jgi:hypothetical protein
MEQNRQDRGTGCSYNGNTKLGRKEQNHTTAMTNLYRCGTNRIYTWTKTLEHGEQDCRAKRTNHDCKGNKAEQKVIP